MKQFVKLWPTALLGEMFSQLFMSFFPLISAQAAY